MFRSFVVACAALLAASCSTVRIYDGEFVHNAPFKLGDGETIYLPVISSGPIPAESDNYRIENAGILRGPSKTVGFKYDMSWGFSATLKHETELESVTVELVFPVSDRKVVVTDAHPTSNGKVWASTTKRVGISPGTTPWLYQPGTSEFVYKFTIKAKGKPTETLFQPTAFPEMVKIAFRG